MVTDWQECSLLGTCRQISTKLMWNNGLFILYGGEGDDNV